MTTATVSIVDFLSDPELGGRHPAFTDLSSWRSWIVFLKALYGLPITDPDELQVFRRHSGRAEYTPPPGGYREACAVVGRQSGKSRVAATIGYGVARTNSFRTRRAMPSTVIRIPSFERCIRSRRTAIPRRGSGDCMSAGSVPGAPLESGRIAASRSLASAASAAASARGSRSDRVTLSPGSTTSPGMRGNSSGNPGSPPLMNASPLRDGQETSA